MWGTRRDSAPGGAGELHGAFEDLIEKSAAFAKRAIDDEFVAGVEDVENDIRYRNLFDHRVRDFLAAEALLNLSEGQCAADVGGAFGTMPGHDLAVEDEVAGESGESIGKFGEGFGDFVESAGVETGLAVSDVSLRTDAVVLVLDLRVIEVSEGFFGGFGGTGEHEADGMKEPHASVAEISSRGAAKGFADVAEQHVGALHLGNRIAERLGDSFFDKGFAQADAKVAAHDLDDVLGLERREFVHQQPNETCFSRGAAAVGNASEFAGDVNDIDGAVPGSDVEKKVGGGGAEIAILAISLGESSL